MAFRFKREGNYTKLRVTQERSGIRPWVDEFKWRVTSWHYQFTMGPLARRALLQNQKHNEGLQFILDAIVSGKSSSKFPSLPITTPYLSSSNPFCPVTPNFTGWREWRPKRIPDLQPHGKHKVGGTDSIPPVWPKFK